jgi:hypothetical protein
MNRIKNSFSRFLRKVRLLYVADYLRYFFVKYQNKKDNEAFKDLESGYIPQFKPRVIESMMCKTLVLVKYDKWNVIEKWFEPEKHFIYWYNLCSFKITHRYM